MKRRTPNKLLQRLGALVLALVLVLGNLPADTFAAPGGISGVAGNFTTVADAPTIDRPAAIYGNDTFHAGKVTVGKSVSDETVTLENNISFTPADGNFIVTSSQTSQVLGLATESTAPVDVVFVLDTSNSMEGREDDLFAAANSAIQTLLKANPENRIGVVAFSGTGGGGTSGGAAANMLSPLAHYDDNGTEKAESEHLRVITSGSGYYRTTLLTGRSSGSIAAGTRKPTSQGTNIHAGVVAGARMLESAQTKTADGVTRIPFLVIMSDGQPSYASSDATWYNPDLTKQTSSLQNVPGVGFLPALTAAYYKGKITEHYFGNSASAQNRCFIYTVGLGLESHNSRDLALMTVDPANQTATNSQFNTFEGYWDNYVATHNSNNENAFFNVNVGGNFRITKETVDYSWNYVNGKLSNGTDIGYLGGKDGYKYNDKYFSAANAGDLNNAFGAIVTTIQQQAINHPTHVKKDHGADFSGYVTYSDPIGEYMEVKAVHGIEINGTLYQGKTFASYLQNWDSAPDAFKTEFAKVLQERCKVTGSTMDVEAFIAAAVASSNQAYYNEADGTFDNSLIWWGQEYTAAGEKDPQVKWLAFADNDTYEYISSVTPPAGATHVCRSYYFYGTAGDVNATPDEDFLHFVVRVQRSLTAPYQETVVISAPASLLSAEKVFVTEKTDSRGNTTYEAKVTKAAPARVVYEVGLRSDINAYNVAQIVGQDTAYISETTQDVANGEKRATNYADGTYTFYTNDWNRAETADSHHRAMAKATFEAAVTNSFYTYTEDTLIYVEDGNGGYVPYTGNTPSGSGYFYAREYYTWSNPNGTSGTFAATKETAYIPVTLPDNGELKQSGNNWYIPKGVYKASSLIAKNEDVYKTENGVRVNPTQTAETVVHPHRTTSATDNHYTVMLGNNGKLTLEAQKTKTVHKNDDLTVNIDGKAVMVGDTLTYAIEVINPDDEPATAEVTDTLPKGTELKKDPSNNNNYIISDGGSYSDGVITWKNIALNPNETKVLTFQVTVTTDLVGVTTIDNTASVELNNGFSYTTNTTKNPPEGKRVVDAEYNELDADDKVGVPEVLEFRIKWGNDTGAVADVIITDELPIGTTFISASHNGKYEVSDEYPNGIITWTLEDVAKDTGGVVSFFANVNPNAGEFIENEANININHNPRVTNKTKVAVEHDDLIVTKTVNAENGSGAFDQEFTLHITEAARKLTGNEKLFKLDTANDTWTEVNGGIDFAGGVATLVIKHGETFKIADIPVGTIFSVTEAAKDGFTPTYYVNDDTTGSAAEGRVAIVEDPEETTGAQVESSAKVAVENDYAPKAYEFNLKGNKVLTATADLEDQRFGFTAYKCDENGANPDQSDFITGEVNVAYENAGQSIAIKFSPKVFSQAGTYYYLLSELNGGVKGMNYDANQYLLRLVIVDDGTGELRLGDAQDDPNMWTGYKKLGDADFTALTENTSITFNNKYEPLEGTLQLKGSKTMDGRTLEEGKYSFEVKQGDKVVTTGTNGENGVIAFKPITYTAADLTSQPFTYTVSEVNGGLSGVTYDPKVYTIVVSLVNDDGQLVASVVSVDGVAVTDNNYMLAFGNTFVPEGVQVILDANKVLNGRTLEAGEFEFVVKDGDAVVASGTNAADGSITFSPIGYSIKDLAGITADENGIQTRIYNYTVEEVIPDLAADPYMTYDKVARKAQVTLTYNANTGDLVATESYPEGAITFANTQNPDTITVVPAVNKTTLDSNGTTTNVPGDITFSFKVVNAVTGVEVPGGVAPANTSDANPAQFSALSFSKAGTYRYWIMESHSAPHHGITYDTDRYLLVVDVELTEGVLSETHKYYQLSAGGDPADYEDYTDEVTIPSFENKYEAKGYISVKAKKVLDGRALNAGEFGFKLVREGTDAGVNGVMAADGTITFADLYYDDAEFTAETPSPKTIKYIMSEIEPVSTKLPGITYDTTPREVYITISKPTGDSNIITAMVTDKDGNVLKSGETPLAYGETGVVFRNDYNVVTGTSITFTGTKTLTGRTLQPGEFSFELWHTPANGNETLVATATNDANGNFSFTRNYPAGVLGDADQIVTTYEIREANNHLAGVTYDNTVLEITVTLGHDNNGNLTVSADKTKNSQGAYVVGGFANTYTPSGVSFKPEAQKDLENRTLRANAFSFEIKDSNGNVVATGMNDENGKVTFSAIGYNTTGEHIYTVTEVKGNLPGVQYDETTKYMKVIVSDNVTEGRLEAEYKFYSNAACTTQTTDVFTNVYAPENTSVQLAANKKLTGRNMKTGEFSFVAKEVTGTTVGDVKATGGNAEANDGAIAAVTFSNIGYTYDMVKDEADKTKEFIYELSEVATSQGGMTFSTAKYYAKVTVSYNAETGELSAVPAYFTNIECTTPATEVLFVNAYAPASVEISLPVDKTLINKKLAENEFTFTLADSKGNVLQTKGNALDGKVEFAPLTFNAPGRYQFLLSESLNTAVAADASCYKMDYDVTIVIDVEDNLMGQLVAKTAYYENYQEGGTNTDLGGAEFTNYYTAPSITVDLTTELNATKELNGRTLRDGEFKFLVYDIYNHVVSKGSNTDLNGDNIFDEIRFETFTFDKAGEYHYWIVEDDKGVAPGVTIDPRVWEVTILVRYNENQTSVKDFKNEDVAIGQLYIAAKDVKTYLYGDINIASVESDPAFVNTYTPTPVDAQIKVTKDLEGRELRNQEFLFQMKDTNGLLLGEARNDADGNVVFDMHYTKAGTYSYWISEVKGDDPSITYDGISRSATVTVTDNGNGQLSAVVSTDTAAVEFKNTYKAASVDAVVEAKKTYSGDKEFDGGIFQFQLVNKNDATEVYTVENKPDGSITFVTKKFDTAGTYTYIMSEVAGTDTKHFAYDTSKYEVTIQVTDDQMGQLEATVTYGTTDAYAPVFVNKYTADPVSVTLQGKKELTGRELKADEFTFKITDGNALELEFGHDEDGNLLIPTIDLPTVGTYVFTITEVKGTEANMTYDETAFQVTVTVSNENGVLKETVTYPDGGVVFKNTYKVPETTQPTEPTTPSVVPDTGDRNNMLGYSALAVLSLGAAMVLVLISKRKKSHS